MKILLFALLLCASMTLVKCVTYFGLWTAWFPNDLAATRERTRQCLPASPNDECTQNHYKEEFISCPNLCIPDPSTQTSGGCLGTCNNASNVISYDCGTDPGCRFTLTYKCFNLDNCAAAWSTWTLSTDCNRLCDGGTQVRSRMCLDETTGNPSINCPNSGSQSSQVQTILCNTQPCPVLSQWAEMGGCSGELQNRTRTCLDNTGPTTGCIGDLHQQLPCTYSVWTNTSCSSECGEGNMTMFRNCSYQGMLSSICPGANADGMQIEVITCNNTGLCGTWNHWLNGICSVTCGSGNMQRSRECQLNGMLSTTCEGGNGKSYQNETVPCNNMTCPELTSWSAMGGCSKACNGGVQNFSRMCKLNGNSSSGCVGNLTKQEDCNTGACNCSTWISVTTCSVACGSGMLNQERLCLQPNGTNTTEMQQVECNSEACGCSAWINTTGCSDVCNNGTLTEERTCIIPSGAQTTDTRQVICNTEVCVYGSWADSSPCSVTCGGGSQQQEQHCTNTGCDKVRNRTVTCNTDACFAVGGGSFTLLIVIASIVGAIVLALLVYVIVPFCCAPCVAGATLHVDTSTAFVIESMQVATLGVIVWHGKTILQHKPLRSFPHCCATIESTKGGDDMPMVPVEVDSTGAPSEDGANESANNRTPHVTTGLDEEIKTVTLQQWVTSMIEERAKSGDVIPGGNVTNNNSRASANHRSPWVHPSSTIRQRPLSAVVTIARRMSTRSELEYNKLK